MTSRHLVPGSSKDPLSIEEYERIFNIKSSRLLKHLGSTRELVNRLSELNRSDWTFRYPGSSNTHRLAGSSIRSQSLDSLNLQQQGSSNIPERPQSVQSNFNIASPSFGEEVSEEPTSSNSTKNLDILRLDVKFGHHSNVRVVDSLEHNSISNLFEDRLAHCLRYLEKMMARISDKNSKVLVTGDLNSGKSTFVNALLKRRVMPSDQQPCTMLFCEVLAVELNNGVEEAHAIPNAGLYNVKDGSTYDRIPLHELFRVVSEDFRGYELVKVYCHDKESTETMLNNGTLDITLIDSPGLNRDSLKTTQLFARQEEIDVVVFCVHAENQFTLSGQEFLQSAGKEKAYIFIVVNRFDTIRDKQKCRRLILDQIRQLSPRTYEDAQDLVHFVAADHCFPYDGDFAYPPNEIPHDFQRLESCLRSFILEKRARSKLAPAKRFALNVLDDISTLSEFNLEEANKQADEIESSLSVILPQYEQTVKDKEVSTKEATKLLQQAVEYSRTEMERVLDLQITNLGEYITRPSWPGFIGVMSYVDDLKYCAGTSISRLMLDTEHRLVEASTSTYRSILGLDREVCGSSNKMLVPPCPITSHKKNVIESMLSNVQFTWFELLDIPAKIRNMSILFSGVTFVGTQLLGVREYIAMSYQLIVDPSSSINSWIIIGLSATGLGVAYLALNDLHKQCNEKVIKKIQSEFRAHRFAVKASERSANNTSKYLQGASGQLYASFTSRIREQEDTKLAHLKLKHSVGLAQAGFSSLVHDAQKLSGKIHKISTEDVAILSPNVPQASL
ncbi:hypothetical protein K502DRAFT_346011 [Neoconidiobolus thromboides FSU 785]|nr:hypothetical protein K502DRAFT_346011 [Neoconidiobolus thromboides FSU 785]